MKNKAQHEDYTASRFRYRLFLKIQRDLDRKENEVVERLKNNLSIPPFPLKPLFVEDLSEIGLRSQDLSKKIQSELDFQVKYLESSLSLEGENPSSFLREFEEE